MLRPIIFITQTSINPLLFTQEIGGEWLEIDLDNKKDLDNLLLTVYSEYPKPINCYLGDLHKLSESFQQACLKLLEEPPKNLQIYLTCSTQSDILPTIQSRCILKNLDNKNLIKILDPKLLENSKKLFPETKVVVQKMLSNSLEFEDLGDISKAEREDLAFYIWQLTYSLEHIYTHFLTLGGNNQKLDLVASKINKLLEVQKYLSANLQKKISLVPIITN
jgi:DNA polymerase III, delta subunit